MVICAGNGTAFNTGALPAGSTFAVKHHRGRSLAPPFIARTMKLPFALLCGSLLNTGYAQFGVLDPSFDGDGIVVTTIGNNSMPQAITLQADGRILVAGNADSSAAIVRYLPDGSLDVTFGSGGIATFDALILVAIADVAVRSDGKILVCGRVGGASTSDLLLARLHSDGSLDTDFGSAGTGMTIISFAPNNGGAAELAIQPDGKIVVAGWLWSNSTARIMRFTGDGFSDDATFGAGGGVSPFYTVPGATSIDLRGMTLQSDGKILVTGTTTTGTSADRYVTRLLTDGSLDAGFGTGGVVTLDMLGSSIERSSDVLVQSDGKILIVGSAHMMSTLDHRAVVTRLLSDGSVDVAYGTAGDAVSPSLQGVPFTQQGLVQYDGKLVFVGHYLINGFSNPHLAWRVDTDGTYDVTFGTGGVVEEPLGGLYTYLFDVSQQADGKLLICGQRQSDPHFHTARLTSGQLVGIPDAPAVSPWAVYPVPADATISISGIATQIGTPLVIRDLAGREAMRVLSDGSDGQVIDVDMLGPGLYTIGFAVDVDRRIAPFIKR